MALPAEHLRPPQAQPPEGDNTPEIVLNWELLTETRAGLDSYLDTPRVVHHILEFVTQRKFDPDYIDQVMKDATSRANDKTKRDELTEQFDRLSATEQGAALLSVIDTLRTQRRVTNENIVELNQFAIAAGTIVLIEHNDYLTGKKDYPL